MSIYAPRPIRLARPAAMVLTRAAAIAFASSAALAVVLASSVAVAHGCGRRARGFLRPREQRRKCPVARDLRPTSRAHRRCDPQPDGGTVGPLHEPRVGDLRGKPRLGFPDGHP